MNIDEGFFKLILSVSIQNIFDYPENIANCSFFVNLHLLPPKKNLEFKLKPLYCGAMSFEIIGKIQNIEIIAVGGNIRDIMRLRKQFGSGRWRKLKGIAKVRLQNGRISRAEVHWYEAHGIGMKKIKIKRILE